MTDRDHSQQPAVSVLSLYSVVDWLGSSWSLVEVITSLICIVTGTSETTQNTESPPVRHLYQHSHQPGSLVPALCFLKLSISFNYRLYETIEDLRETISRENTLLVQIKLVFFILYRFDIILDMSRAVTSLSVHLSFVLVLKQRPLNIFPSPYFIKLTLWN